MLWTIEASLFVSQKTNFKQVGNLFSTVSIDLVAKFINQRGRVAINELVEQSNKLIRLEAAN